MSNPQADKPVKWTGDQWDYEMDGLKMDVPPAGIHQQVSLRGNDGWELCSTLPMPSPNQPEGDDDVVMCWALIYKRKRSALVRV